MLLRKSCFKVSSKLYDSEGYHTLNTNHYLVKTLNLHLYHLYLAFVQGKETSKKIMKRVYVI